jgi:hypothetical protein
MTSSASDPPEIRKSGKAGSGPFRVVGFATRFSERKGAAPVFAAGWRSRESLLAARRGDYPHGYYHSEDHPVVVMLAAEYDGDPAAVIHEFDPFQR